MMKDIMDWTRGSNDQVRRFAANSTQCAVCELYGWTEEEFTQDDMVCNDCHQEEELCDADKEERDNARRRKEAK